MRLARNACILLFCLLPLACTSREPLAATNANDEAVDGAPQRIFSLRGTVGLISGLEIKNGREYAAWSEPHPGAYVGQMYATDNFGYVHNKGALQMRRGNLGVGPGCYGNGGFSDLETGASVIVRDETGRIIGTGSLGAGYDNAILNKLASAKSRAIASERTRSTCLFDFEIPSLPRASHYAITVSHRGESVFSFAELAASDWTIPLSIGP